MVIKPLATNAFHCGIYFRKKEKIHLIILPEGMFSLVSHDMVEKHIDDVLVAMTRVLVAHVANSPDSIGGDFVRQEIARLEGAPLATGPMTWADLPGAAMRYFVTPEDTISCGLRVGREAAIFISIHDPALVFSWARFSTCVQDRIFQLAFGRIVISNTQVVRSGPRRW